MDLYVCDFAICDIGMEVKKMNIEEVEKMKIKYI